MDFNPPPTQPTLFTSLHARRQLSKLPAGKAAGPDGVSPQVLRACAEQLCGVLHYVFDMSLSLHMEEKNDMEDALPRSSPKNAAAQRSLGLPTGGFRLIS